MNQTESTPQGYKQTKIGLIPEDWEWLKSGSVIKLFGGAAFKSSDSQDNGVKWLKIANVGINEIKWDILDYLPEIVARDFEKYLLVKGDIVMALTRPILSGKLKIARITETDESLLNQRVAKLETRKDNSQLFCYYLVQTPYFIHSLESAMAGTDPPNLGNKDFYNIPIPLPPLPEQQKIAEILSTWDTTITELDQLIAAKKQLKKGLMQQLLTGQKRFPEFLPKEDKKTKESPSLEEGRVRDGSKPGYKQTKLGLVPEDWEVTRFEDCVKKILGGGTPSRENVDYWNGDIPWCTVKDLVGVKLTQTQESITNLGLDNSSANLIPKNTLILATRMAVGKVVWFNKDVAINQDLKALILKHGVDRGYVYYLLDLNKPRLEGLSVGSTVMGLGLNDLRKLSIQLPALPAQQKIAATLSAIDDEIQALETQKTAYQTQKKGLMQVLLTGRVRVKV
jgi:type I restriction enzyme S subunit